MKAERDAKAAFEAAERAKSDAIVKAKLDSVEAFKQRVYNNTSERLVAKAETERRLREESIAKAKSEEQEKIRKDEEKKLKMIAASEVKKKEIEDARLKQLAEQAALKLARLEALKAYVNSINKTISVPTNTQTSLVLSKKEQYLKDLASKYPEGITEENEDGVNCKVTRVILVANGKADEYKKVAFNYGAVFYKKNDMDISEIKFKQETKR